MLAKLYIYLQEWSRIRIYLYTCWSRIRIYLFKWLIQDPDPFFYRQIQDQDPFLYKTDLGWIYLFILLIQDPDLVIYATDFIYWIDSETGSIYLQNRSKIRIYLFTGQI